MNTKESRERLIDEVKKYPVLYDTRHENHRDMDVRDRCWNEISERLATNSDVLKREWKILRDSLRQSLKKTRRGATTKAGLPCKKWRFQNRMAFVLPYMTIRRNARLPVKEDVKIDEAEIQSDHSVPSEALDPAPDENDSLDLFFASICQSTKRLPRKYQAQMKKLVLDTLLKVEEDFNTDTDTKTDVYKRF